MQLDRAGKVASSQKAMSLTLNALTTPSMKVVPPQVQMKKITPKKITDAPAPVLTPRSEVSVSEVPTLNQRVSADLKDLYMAELHAKIDANKFYPPISKRMGQTGTVIVAFTLLEDGTIMNVKIQEPSSFERLNEAGLEAVRKIKRFRPIPKELGMTAMDFRIPVKFITL